MLSAIILAAGRGTRLETKTSKALVKINRKPLINYSLGIFNSHPEIDEIITVVSRDNKKQIIAAVKKAYLKKIKVFVLGGARRQDSVFNGLKQVSSQSDWVLIHDSARPFIDRKSITKVIKEAKRTGAAILGVPVKATIKKARHRAVIQTMDRSCLWEIQTPQVFKKEFLLEAYKKFSKNDFTDDASLIEKLDKKVKIVTGRYENIKITTKVDLLFAQLIAKGS
ncbi:MAG: 2-C-methyl-D-erythritol 4-phosphate cytidylyltransferase [Candidatus Omnitrophota bacterium]